MKTSGAWYYGHVGKDVVFSMLQACAVGLLDDGLSKAAEYKGFAVDAVDI